MSCQRGRTPPPVGEYRGTRLGPRWVGVAGVLGNALLSAAPALAQAPVPALPVSPPAPEVRPAPAPPAPPEMTAVAPPPAPPPPASSPPPPSFGSDPFGAVGAAVAGADIALKLYGDTGMAVRDNAHQPWQTFTSNANVYSPGVNVAFFAPRLDLFGSASVDKLSFLTEIMFEGINNSIGVDVERVQVSWQFAEWLRLTAGRKHLAWGYYNDTYHHGNIFELTTSRPYSVDFEDSLGIVMSHLIGVAADGTFKLGKEAYLRYDLEAGNPRSADITAVSVQYAESAAPTVNARLRLMPADGLILGVNGMRDLIPALASSAAPTRPETEELVAGAHVVYTEHHVLLDAEGFFMKHNPDGLPSTTLGGGFLELGYTLGAFTPYVRPEFLRFPSTNDVIFQYLSGSAEGQIVGANAVYANMQNFFDLRVGVKWLVIPQLALKLELDRLGRDAQHMEYATVKVDFGF